MFNSDELKILKQQYNSLIFNLHLYIDNLYTKLIDCENKTKTYQYRISKIFSHLIIFFVFFSSFLLQETGYKICALILSFLFFSLNYKMLKTVDYYTFFGIFIKERRELISFVKKLSILSKTDLIKSLNHIHDNQKEINILKDKTSEFSNFYKKEYGSLKIRIISSNLITNLIISSLILLFIFFFKTNMILINIEFLFILLSFPIITNIFLLNYVKKKKDYFFISEIDYGFEILNKAVSSNKYPNRLMRKHYDNIYYTDFRDFEFLIKCPKCQRLIHIEDISSEKWKCEKCGKIVINSNLVIFAKSLGIIHYCINCGYPNQYKVDKIFRYNSSCSNCTYNQDEMGPEVFVELFFNLKGCLVNNRSTSSLMFVK